MKDYALYLGNISNDFTTDKHLIDKHSNVASNNTKCVSLSNQKCMIQTILINLHPNEYS